MQTFLCVLNTLLELEYVNKMFHLMTALCMQTYKMVLPNDRLQDIRFAVWAIQDGASLRTRYSLSIAGNNFWCSCTSRRILFLLIIETSN